MTRSSQPVRGHILEFDDDFERTLRRKRKQPEVNPPSSSFESEFQEEEEEQDMVVDNRTSRNFQPQDWTMSSLFAFNTLGQLKEKPMSLN